MLVIIFWFNSAFALDLSGEEAVNVAKTSFSELSDISRNIQEKLVTANKNKDMEQIQCINARSVSINTLVDFSRQSLAALRNKDLSPALVKSELKKIEFALRSANKYKDEVDACLASTISQSTGQGSLLLVDDSRITSLLTTDEANFGIQSTENAVSQIDSSTSGTSSSGDLDSESTPPPPASSPYQ